MTVIALPTTRSLNSGYEPIGANGHDFLAGTGALWSNSRLVLEVFPQGIGHPVRHRHVRCPSTSAGLRAPGIVEATAGWASPNWSAAAFNWTLYRPQTDDMRRARSRISGGAFTYWYVASSDRSDARMPLL